MNSFMRFIGACSFAFFGVVSPAFATTYGPNLIGNGDFEQVDDRKGQTHSQQLGMLKTGPGSSWDVYGALPGGWTTSDGPGIEIQTNRTLSIIDSKDAFGGGAGHHYVELDSHGGTDTNSGMKQTLALGAGEYVFSFFYSPRTGNLDADDNLITWEILPGLGGGWISGPNPFGSPATKVGEWTHLSTMFEVLAPTNVTVHIFAGGKDNSLGGFVDNVSVVQVMPLPGPILFAVTAFGLAGAVRRFSRSA